MKVESEPTSGQENILTDSILEDSANDSKAESAKQKIQQDDKKGSINLETLDSKILAIKMKKKSKQAQ